MSSTDQVGPGNGVETDYFYAPIPEELLYSALTDKAVRVYGTLARHGMTKDDCFPSHRRIAQFIGCAPRSVKRPLEELEEAGWIESVPRFDARGDRTSNGYLVRIKPKKRDKTTTSSAPPAQESAEGVETSSAPPAFDSAYPPRSGARTPHASERDEREPLNESHRNHLAPADGGALEQLLVEALQRVCGLGDTPTRSELAGWRKAARELAAAGATETDVAARATAYATKYPTAALTPHALAKHWASLSSATPARSGVAGSTERARRNGAALARTDVSEEELDQHLPPSPAEADAFREGFETARTRRAS